MERGPFFETAGMAAGDSSSVGQRHQDEPNSQSKLLRTLSDDSTNNFHVAAAPTHHTPSSQASGDPRPAGDTRPAAAAPQSAGQNLSDVEQRLREVAAAMERNAEETREYAAAVERKEAESAELRRVHTELEQQHQQLLAGQQQQQQQQPNIQQDQAQLQVPQNNKKRKRPDEAAAEINKAAAAAAPSDANRPRMQHGQETAMLNAAAVRGARSAEARDRCEICGKLFTEKNGRTPICGNQAFSSGCRKKVSPRGWIGELVLPHLKTAPFPELEALTQHILNSSEVQQARNASSQQRMTELREGIAYLHKKMQEAAPGDEVTAAAPSNPSRRVSTAVAVLPVAAADEPAAAADTSAHQEHGPAAAAAASAVVQDICGNPNVRADDVDLQFWARMLPDLEIQAFSGSIILLFQARTRKGSSFLRTLFSPSVQRAMFPPHQFRTKPATLDGVEIPQWPYELEVDPDDDVNDLVLRAADAGDLAQLLRVLPSCSPMAIGQALGRAIILIAPALVAPLLAALGPAGVEAWMMSPEGELCLDMFAELLVEAPVDPSNQEATQCVHDLKILRLFLSKYGPASTTIKQLDADYVTHDEVSLEETLQQSYRRHADVQRDYNPGDNQVVEQTHRAPTLSVPEQTGKSEVASRPVRKRLRASLAPAAACSEVVTGTERQSQSKGYHFKLDKSNDQYKVVTSQGAQNAQWGLEEEPLRKLIVDEADRLKDPPNDKYEQIPFDGLHAYASRVTQQGGKYNFQLGDIEPILAFRRIKDGKEWIKAAACNRRDGGIALISAVNSKPEDHRAMPTFETGWYVITSSTTAPAKFFRELRRILEPPPLTKAAVSSALV